MRPHRLEITAFGPFAQTAVVDFDELAAAGLMLLHGDTGAGKTSVLDALGYALYGEVPGVRGVKRLRSDHADAAVETRVRLEFTAGGRRLRITRSPRQEVAKLRGTGLRVLQPQVRLEQRSDGQWRHLAERLDEAGAIIGDVVGLSATQFFQVVLLPQGGFAHFLHAPAAERQQLLERLFGTRRFADVERALAERRSALAERLRDTTTALKAQLDTVAASATDELAQDTPADCADVYSEDVDSAHIDSANVVRPRDLLWAREQLVSLDAQSHVAQAEWETAQLREADVRQEAARVEELADRQRRRARALAEHERLQADEARIERLREGIEAARRAAVVAASLGLLERSERLVMARTADYDEAAARLPGQLRGLNQEQAQAAERDVRRQLAEVESLLPLVAQAERAAAEAQTAEKAADAARAALDGAIAVVDLAKQRRVEAEQSLTSARVDAAGAAEARDLAEAAQRKLGAAGALPAARLRESQARAAAADARDVWLTARERAVELRARRLAGMAAELAADLQDGVACAVCGSPDHPDPARSDDRVDDATERQAAQAVDAAAELLEAAQLAVTSVAADALRLTTVCGDRPDEVILRAEAAAAAERAASSAVAEASLADLAKAFAGASLALTQSESAHAAAGQALQERERQAAATAATAGSLQERLQAAGTTDLTDRQTTLRETIAALEAYRRALEVLGDARESRDRARHDCHEQAVAAGFESTEQAQLAVRTPEQLRDLVDEVRRHDDALAATRTALADPELNVPLQPAADPEAAAVAVTQAVQRAQSAHALWVQLGSRLGDAQAAVERAAALELEAAPLREQAAMLDSLAELAAGGAGNRLRMSLSAFVLAARLEQVAARASVRLAAMTSGRYTLHHTDEVSDARRKHGLGLAVRDVWTGAERPTASLSGGETFMTSLALALGLADVAAEEAGGRRIDALFIDEGFGTLDEQALDRVMEVIDGLRGGGRLVGVVSHVAELRRRVPAQLHVLRSESGSTLRMHVPVG
jgi:exonuclease SbcC